MEKKDQKKRTININIYIIYPLRTDRRMDPIS